MTQLTLLFDLDGTLADTAIDIALAVDAMLADYGKPPAGLDKVRQWIGGGARVLVGRALAANGLPAEDSDLDTAMQVFMPCYGRSNATTAPLYPGVADTLATLSASNTPMAIVTNKPYRFAVEVLAFLDIQQHFPVVIGGDTLPVAKPNPEPLRHALSEIGGDLQQCWMIGDSATDINGARNAGIRSGWVPYGYHGGQTAEDLRPDRVLTTFSDVLSLD